MEYSSDEEAEEEERRGREMPVPGGGYQARAITLYGMILMRSNMTLLLHRYSVYCMYA